MHRLTPSLVFCLAVVACTEPVADEKEQATHDNFLMPPELVPRLSSGEMLFELAVKPEIVDIEDDLGCYRHCLRSYDGNTVQPGIAQAGGATASMTRRALGPTIRIPAQPGPRSFRLSLENQLETESLQWVADEQFDVNATNFHTHGLHISPDVDPQQPSYWADNVLLNMCPRECYRDPEQCQAHTPCSPKDAKGVMSELMAFQHRFAIDEFERHEPGTFWYHAHKHGVTSLNLSNGMAGALIIEDEIDGEICALAGASKDVCTHPQKLGFERLFLLQQLNYRPVADEPTAPFSCEDDSVQCAWAGPDSPPPPFTIDSFSLATKNDTTVPFLVNGIVQPRFSMQRNQLERWRLIHAGINRNVDLELGPEIDGECMPPTDLDGTEFADRPRVVVHRMAIDGLLLEQTYAAKRVSLSPGNRVDLLVSIGLAGNYCLWDGATFDSLSDEDEAFEPAALLARISVGQDGPEGDEGVNTSIAAISEQIRNHRGQRPALDCKTTMPTAQVVHFRQGKDTEDPFCADRAFENFSLNGLRFGHHALDKCIALYDADGQPNVEQWHLTSTNGNHPFHIHVNPFTVCAGEPFCADGDDSCIELGAHWRDTLRVDKAEQWSIRQRYQHYTGGFVQHCHLLNHEDQGMMQALEISADGPDTCSLPERLPCCPEGKTEDCCIGAGADCLDHHECCSGYCNDDGVCCGYVNDDCTVDDDCCSGLCDQVTGMCAKP